MKPRDKQPITIGTYTLDASIRETHTFESQVTTFPVEQGSPIADNIRLLPIGVEIEYVVSDTPLDPIAVLRESAEESVSPPSVGALAYLLSVRENRQPVPIATAVQRYENMALQSLVVPRDATTGEALGFTATFTQITIVQNQRTTIAVRTTRPQDAAKRNISKNGDVVGPHATITYVVKLFKADASDLDPSIGYTKGQIYEQQYGAPVFEDLDNLYYKVDPNQQPPDGSIANGVFTPMDYNPTNPANPTSWDPSSGSWVGANGLPTTIEPPSNVDQWSP